MHLTNAVVADDSGSGRRAQRTTLEFLPIRHPQEFSAIIVRTRETLNTTDTGTQTSLDLSESLMARLLGKPRTSG